MGEAVEHFSYDKVGNRTTDAKTGTNQWSYNKNNELQGFDTTSFKYNLNGQLTEKTVVGNKTTFSYNLDGRLSEIKDNSNQIIAQYQYDPFGRRLSKTLPKNNNQIIYFYYSDEGLIAEFNEVGNLIQSYGYKPDSDYMTDPVFTQRPDFISKAKGGYVYYINDHLSTPQKLITETGRKVWEANVDAFGKMIITNNEFRNLLRFPGQYADGESSLSYNYQRYFDSLVGRYISSDPIGIDSGINTYSYVDNSPVIWFDAYGLYRDCSYWGGTNCRNVPNKIIDSGCFIDCLSNYPGLKKVLAAGLGGLIANAKTPREMKLLGTKGKSPFTSADRRLKGKFGSKLNAGATRITKSGRVKFVGRYGTLAAAAATFAAGYSVGALMSCFLQCEVDDPDGQIYSVITPGSSGGAPARGNQCVVGP